MRRLVWWLRWHRRLGAMVAVLIVVLAITGILINHSHELGWHRQPVHSALLARLYGIPHQPVDNGFALDAGWIVQSGHQLFLDRQPLQDCVEPLQGAVAYDDMLALLCGDQLLLLDQHGQWVEQLRNLPPQPRGLAQAGGQLLLGSAGGMFVLDDATGHWQPLSATDTLTKSARWAQLQTLPPVLVDFHRRQTPVPGLSRERVLLDLHSGRLFGKAGVWVVDLVGVATCLLALSGLLAWFGRWRRHRQR